jgi:FtsH-binding integral membrane protein
MDDLQPSNLSAYTRRCFMVLLGVLCGTLVMVAASFAPINSPGLRIALILAVAAVNATLVATFLMHIVSEKRFVLVTLAFTLIFFVALMGLTWIAQHDVPSLVAPK